MKILQITNTQTNNNQPNFQARNLIVHCFFSNSPEKVFLPSQLGRVITDFNPQKRMYTVGVLKSIIRKLKHPSDFLFCRQTAKTEKEAQTMHQRLLDAVQMAKNTDGPPIHLNNDDFTLLENMKD